MNYCLILPQFSTGTVVLQLELSISSATLVRVHFTVSHFACSYFAVFPYPNSNPNP